MEVAADELAGCRPDLIAVAAFWDYQARHAVTDPDILAAAWARISIGHQTRIMSIVGETEAGEQDGTDRDPQETARHHRIA